MNILIPHSWLLEHLETDASPEEIQKILSLSGPSVERIHQIEGEAVYDVEVTTNRVDSMSVRGIAREAAVILSNAGKQGSLRHPRGESEVQDEALLHRGSSKIRHPGLDPGSLDSRFRGNDEAKVPLPTITNNPDLCKRIIYIVLTDIKRNPTPDWMAKRLNQTEINVHDAAIDITNYVTHELGHPCHAFDYDKIMALGGEIIVKVAEAGKSFTTLDGENYTTVGGEVVFENQAGEIIDLPGIKGTANTAVDQSTKNILFWIESIEPSKIRFGSMSHAIRTTAAQLNEKNVDPALADSVLKRGIELYQQLCDAKLGSNIIDEFPRPRDMKPIELKLSRVKDYLGVDIDPDQIKNILIQLGCEVTIRHPRGESEVLNEEKDEALLHRGSSIEVNTANLDSRFRGNDGFQVTPPTYRPDLTIPADLIEEIARIYGYHNLESKLMDTAIPLMKQAGVNFDLELKIKHFLANIGWQEVYTYSMVGEEIAKQSGYSLEEHLKLQNPLTDDKVYLRRSLWPSLSEVIDVNPPGNEYSVFEVANVYQPQSDLPDEMMLLTLVSNRDFRQVKGDIEALLDQLHIDNISVEPNNPSIPMLAQSGIIKTGTEELGTIAVLTNGRTVATFGIKNLINHAKSHPSYRPIPTTSQIVEDLTFTLPEGTLAGDVIDAIINSAEEIIQVDLKDIYQQNYSFTLTFHDPSRNLSSADIEPVRKQVIETVDQKFQAELVGPTK